MQKTALAMIAVIAVISSIGSAVWPFSNFQATDTGTPEQITIGKMPLMAHALIYIAEDLGYFTDNGLNVTLRRIPINSMSMVPITNTVNIFTFLL